MALVLLTKGLIVFDLKLIHRPIDALIVCTKKILVKFKYGTAFPWCYSGIVSWYRICIFISNIQSQAPATGNDSWKMQYIDILF